MRLRRLWVLLLAFIGGCGSANYVDTTVMGMQ
jgi:hypothetical protein